MIWPFAMRKETSFLRTVIPAAWSLSAGSQVNSEPVSTNKRLKETFLVGVLGLTITQSTRNTPMKLCVARWSDSCQESAARNERGRRIDVGAGLRRRTDQPQIAWLIRACPPNGQPHRVAPTNIGETEPLPGPRRSWFFAATVIAIKRNSTPGLPAYDEASDTIPHPLFPSSCR